MSNSTSSPAISTSTATNATPSTSNSTKTALKQILKSDLEARSISGTVITSVAAALLLVAAILSFMGRHSLLGSLTIVLVILVTILAIIFAKFCNCTILLTTFMTGFLNKNSAALQQWVASGGGLPYPTLQFPTNTIMIIVVTIATVSSAAALAFTMWSSSGDNLIVTALFAFSFILLLTGSIIGGVWLSFKQSNLIWCIDNMSDKSKTDLISTGIGATLQTFGVSI